MIDEGKKTPITIGSEPSPTPNRRWTAKLALCIVGLIIALWLFFEDPGLLGKGVVYLAVAVGAMRLCRLIFRKLRMAARSDVTTKDLAPVIAQMALLPLENPSEQDASFQGQAERVGVDRNRFIFEAVALQCYAMTAAINRERLEGRVPASVAELLVKQFIYAVHNRLQQTPSVVLTVLGLDPDSALELIMERGEKYAQPAHGHGSRADVWKFFADFCEHPGSGVLERIGWSLFQVRGDSSGDWLKTLNIVPST